MDAYLECLQNYIEEHLLEGPSPYLTEYHCMRSEAGRARAALEASLTEEQGALWEAFQITVFGIRHDIREGGGVREVDGSQLIRP